MKAATLLAGVLITSALATTAAIAADDYPYPKQAFDATFLTTSPNGNVNMRMLSDGKGHTRSETSVAGTKSVVISDYPNKVAYSIMEAQKMIVKVPLSPAVKNSVQDAESAKRMNAKSLGAKTVNGHPCHGWEYTTKEGKSTVWTGDDIDYVVQSITLAGPAKMQMDLKTFVKKVPSADSFKVPTVGYKTMEVPSAGGK